MTSTMTQHVEHSEDFTKAHVESWLRILGIFISSGHENACNSSKRTHDENKKSKRRPISMYFSPTNQ